MPEQHSLLRAPGLGLTVQVDETQEVHAKLKHNREDGVQVEDVGQRPLPGEGLEGLQWQGRGQGPDLPCGPQPTLPPSRPSAERVSKSWGSRSAPVLRDLLTPAAPQPRCHTTLA